MLLFGQLVNSFGDRGERLGWRQAVRVPRSGPIVTNQALEPRDPHHEKLIEVRAEDRQKLDPLEQRHAFVLGFFKHAAIELEPGQFAIDVSVRIHNLPIRAAHFRKIPCYRNNQGKWLRQC